MNVIKVSNDIFIPGVNGYKSDIACPNCGAIGQSIFNPIGDIAYNPRFTCQCGKSYEIETRIVKTELNYKEIK